MYTSAILIGLLAAPSFAGGLSESNDAGWAPPKIDDLKGDVRAWLDEVKADQTAKDKANDVWRQLSQSPTELQVLAALGETFSLADERAKRLVELCATPKRQYGLPDQSWLRDAKTPGFEAKNLRVVYGRWLAQAEMFDEALDELGELKPEEVAAPATLLFYQSVARHSLLDRDGGLESIGKLLAGEQASPRRYVALAKLMQEDLEFLKNDSLDHVARRMSDVRRRLELGRAGKKVQDQEGGIIESLDKMIKRLEEQQQQSQGSAQIADSIRSSSPAPDSLPIGGKAPGEVQKRPVGDGADWGDLPPKQREEALQRIGRDFPSHYRDVIEQYFRRLAAGDNEEGR